LKYWLTQINNLIKNTMRKILSLLFLLATIFILCQPAEVKAKTLYECFMSKGQKWTSVADRAPLAASYGILQYKGSKTQNSVLSDAICGPSDMLGAGFSVATGYQKTLRASMTASQSYFYPASLLLKDGTAISTSTLGEKIFFVIEPGKDKEEIVLCTSIDSTNTKIENCTRGLAFSGTSTTAVSGLAYAHNSGSIVVMSNVHYVYEQYVDTNAKDQTIAGLKIYTSTNTFYLFPVVSSTGYTGLPSSNGQLATKYYVDTVGAGGFTAANVSTTHAIEALGTSPETIGVIVSSTKGMYGGTDGQGIYQKASSTAGILQDTNGMYLDSSYVVLDSDTTSTPTANMIPIANANANLESWIASSSITSLAVSATTTLNNVVVNGTPDFVQWKFISSGTQTNSSTFSTTTPTGAKVAIIHMEGKSNNCNFIPGGEITIFPADKTTGFLLDSCTAAYYWKSTATWSGSTISIAQISDGGAAAVASQSVTFYYYK
jgi:hypothetical protein